jgi:hypothetical protein
MRCVSVLWVLRGGAACADERRGCGCTGVLPLHVGDNEVYWGADEGMGCLPLQVGCLLQGADEGIEGLLLRCTGVLMIAVAVVWGADEACHYM